MLDMFLEVANSGQVPVDEFVVEPEAQDELLHLQKQVDIAISPNITVVENIQRVN